MYEKIDGYIADVLHIPLNFLCKLTGRSNYFFAIVTMLCSMTAHTLFYLYKLLFGKFDFIDGFLWPSNFLFDIFMIVLFRIDQSKVESSSDVINRSQFTGSIWLFFRVFIFIVNLNNLFFDLLTDNRYTALSPLALLLWVISIYFAIDTMPPSNGWVQKVLTKLSTAAKRAMLLPSPIPPPIPG